MGGLFGVASKGDCLFDLFFGTDYHSHLGTRRGGMAVYGENGFDRAIHNIENTPFRTKFDRDMQEMKGNLGVGCISDYEPQPLLVRSHHGTFAITTHCADVHALLQWVDQFYTEEVHILASAGEENTDYIVDPDGTWRMTAAAQNNTYFTSETLITSGTAVPGLSSDAFQRRYSDSTVCYISEQLDVVNASAQRPFPYYSLTKAQQEEIAPLQAAIGRLVDESIARWVLGEVEITDASFAQFGQDLNDAGLPAFMAFWQKILDGGNSK